MVRTLEIDWGKARRVGAASLWDRLGQYWGFRDDYLVHSVADDHPVSVFARAAAKKLGVAEPTVHIFKDLKNEQSLHAFACSEECPKGVWEFLFKRNLDSFERRGYVRNGVYLSAAMVEEFSLGELGAVLSHELEHLGEHDLRFREGELSVLKVFGAHFPKQREEFRADFGGAGVVDTGRMKSALMRSRGVGLAEESALRSGDHPPTRQRLRALELFERAMESYPDGVPEIVQEEIIARVVEEEELDLLINGGEDVFNENSFLDKLF